MSWIDNHNDKLYKQCKNNTNPPKTDTGMEFLNGLIIVGAMAVVMSVALIAFF